MELRTQRDDGPSAMDTVPWIAVGAVALVALIFVQQWGGWLQSATLSGAAQQRAWAERIDKPALDSLTLESKVIAKLLSMELFEEEALIDEDAEEVIEALASSATTAAEEVRVAIVAGELVGPEAAINRLDDNGPC